MRFFATREAAQRHEDQQRLVRRAAVVALPYADVVEEAAWRLALRAFCRFGLNIGVRLRSLHKA